MKNESAHRGKKEENSDGHFLCVPHCILLFALCPNRWTSVGSINRFPFPGALTGLSSGEAHQETREERSLVGYIFLRLPPYRLPQAARVLQVRASAPCYRTLSSWISVPLPAPPLHPFKLGRRSSSTVTALGCFTISWIPPSPAHAFINSPFIQSSKLS